MAGKLILRLPPLLSSRNLNLSIPSGTNAHERSSQSHQAPNQTHRRLGIACHRARIPRAAVLLFSEMGVDRTDKENLPTSTAAVAHPHGVVVRRCKLKLLGRARRRVPLRDITNLFNVESAVAEWQPSLLQQPRHEGSAAAELSKKNGPAGGAALKRGKYLLQKEFR